MAMRALLTPLERETLGRIRRDGRGSGDRVCRRLASRGLVTPEEAGVVTAKVAAPAPPRKPRPRGGPTRRERAEAGELLPCCICGQKQDAAEFGWRPGHEPRSRCKACDRAINRARAKAGAKRTRSAYRWPREKRSAYQKSPRGLAVGRHLCAAKRLREAEAAGASVGRIARLRAKVEAYALARAAFAAVPRMSPLAAGVQEAAEAELFRRNVGLVYPLANGLLGLGEKVGLDFDDLLQFGLIGLHRFARAYDPARRNKFSTGATWAIRNEILHGLRDSGGYIGQKYAHEKRATVTTLDPDAMALAFAVTDPEPGGEDASLVVSRLLASLPAREREVLTIRYGIGRGEGLSLKLTGKIMGLSDEGVRQIEGLAMRRLATIAKAGQREASRWA